MAYFDITRPTAPGALNRTVDALVGAVATWRETRINRAALSRLSDRELSDIGLQRSDLEDMARRRKTRG